jgi:hypothetical protein
MSIEMEPNDIASTIDFHRAYPDVSLSEHVRKKRIQLGVEVTCKYKIYLDSRFWILLREIELGRNDNRDLITLLSQIKCLVDNGVAICPISESIFVELMKQNDPETRTATSKLIDRLSFGVTLIVHPQRVKQELCNAIYMQAGANNLIPIEELVWTKLTSIFGDTHPYQTPFEASEELVIQKSFYDHLWNISLTEMVGYLDFSKWHQPDWQQTADRLNAGNKKHANEIRSFRQAYRVEFEGGLSLFKEDMLRLFKEVDDAGYKDFERNSENLSKNERFSRFSKSIPTLHIEACCHATVRWDQKRQLNGNDLLDFHHAAAAIGYCNLFLTEKSLKALVSQHHLGLVNDFPCKIESSATGALRVLNDVANKAN